MLCTIAYPRDYVEECRDRVAAQVAAWQTLSAAVTGRAAKLLPAFEHEYFANMVITLDVYFTHRSRTAEGKDGDPVNEVRVLANCLVANDGIFSLTAKHESWHATLKTDKSIKYDAARSVLGYKVGDAIAITEAEFVRLADAYFAAVEERFM
jgi:hypothetical protein